MAVYTKLKEKDINNILSNYSIGKLKFFKGIQEGIENTNYYLLVEEKKYVLTIYEKRVNPKDLPFFSSLMTGLNLKNFKCPVPIINNHSETITNYNGKVFFNKNYPDGTMNKNLDSTMIKKLKWKAKIKLAVGLQEVIISRSHHLKIKNKE